MRPVPGDDPDASPPTFLRLLVVEDEMSTLFAIREFFALPQHEVDCATDPIEALRLLDAHPYDVIITDLNLTPSRSGEGLLVASYARKRNPRACVIMLTAYGTEATRDEALRCGVDVYQTKPVELAQLTAHLSRVLQRDSDADRRGAGDAV